jgi:hypothetical protein
VLVIGSAGGDRIAIDAAELTLEIHLGKAQATWQSLAGVAMPG